MSARRSPSQLAESVPIATPMNPVWNMSTIVRLIAIFITLVAIATVIGINVVCIPKSHPCTALVARSAGADMRTMV